jgi:hypothetical protein
MTLTGISSTLSLLHDSNHDYVDDDCEGICTVSVCCSLLIVEGNFVVCKMACFEDAKEFAILRARG